MSALRWADVDDAADGDGALVTVRRGKTNQEGETRDVRFVKGAVAGAIRTLQAATAPAPEDRVVPLSPKMVGLRFQAAARAAGVEHVTAHSGRVGLASELTSRGASTTDVMLAGNWKNEPDGGALLGRGDRRRVPTRSVLKYTPRVQLTPSGAREPASGAQETASGGRPTRLTTDGGGLSRRAPASRAPAGRRGRCEPRAVCGP